MHAPRWSWSVFLGAALSVPASESEASAEVAHMFETLIRANGAATLLPLEAGQTFAIEPSVMLPRPVEGGTWVINVEEEVLVTEKGATYLAPPQETLYLIATPDGAGEEESP